jgi:uncharacterized protein YndB with AHSA1/START domain
MQETQEVTGTVKSRTAYINAPAEQVWRALTDPDLTVQYVGARVRSTWRPGDHITYMAPDSDQKTFEGRLIEVEPNRKLVLECRWLFTPELAADQPHRETFELEPVGEVTRLTATFAYQRDDSPTKAACDMARTGDNLKSLLETGKPIF